MIKYSAKTIATYLNGVIEGNPDVEISTISKIEEGEKGSLAFLANPKYAKYLYTTNASIILINKDFIPEKKIDKTLIKVDNAYSSFASLLDLYNNTINNKQFKGIDKLSFVDSSATIAKDVYIGPFSFIGENATIGKNVKIHPQVYIAHNVTIGDNTTLYPGVKIYHDCKIGQNCTIHAGTVIGSDGFGFAKSDCNQFNKVPQIGNVVIEDWVEIGSNTTIDRATMGSTLIRKGVKLDNLIQIAHNVEIGENTVIAAQSGVAGSTKIGKDCMIAGQVGIVGHITIADNTKIAAQSGIGQSIKESGKIVQGSPSFDIHQYQKSYVLYRKLPELYDQINKMAREIEELKDQLKKQ